MPPLEVLYKLRQKKPEVFNRLEGTHSILTSMPDSLKYFSID
jgi:hypothetical protein